MIRILYIDTVTGEQIGQDLLSDEEVKALETDIHSVQDWIANAIHNKARQCIDKVVLKHSDLNPNKVREVDKFAVVKKAKLETAAEREVREDAELLARLQPRGE